MRRSEPGVSVGVAPGRVWRRGEGWERSVTKVVGRRSPRSGHPVSQHDRREPPCGHWLLILESRSVLSSRCKSGDTGASVGKTTGKCRVGTP